MFLSGVTHFERVEYLKWYQETVYLDLVGGGNE